MKGESNATTNQGRIWTRSSGVCSSASFLGTSSHLSPALSVYSHQQGVQFSSQHFDKRQLIRWIRRRLIALLAAVVILRHLGL